MFFNTLTFSENSVSLIGFASLYSFLLVWENAALKFALLSLVTKFTVSDAFLRDFSSMSDE